MTTAEEHARRLLRCYPGTWRERYGDDLEALLIDDLTERPRSFRRDLDVVRAGLLARLAAYGLARGPVRDPAAATFVAMAATVVFVASALSIWTQLADGWLTAPPDTTAFSIGLVTLSAWLGVLTIAACAVGIRLTVAAFRSARAGGTVQVLRPLPVLVASAGVLVAGARVTASRWPGARLAHHDGLLQHAARIGWAITDTISTFWVHPHILITLPVSELAWMALSPVAAMAFAWAAASVVRSSRVRAPRPLRGARWVVGAAIMPCFVTAAAWVVGSQHAASATYRAGTLDLALIAVMVTSAYVVRNALDSARPHEL